MTLKKQFALPIIYSMKKCALLLLLPLLLFSSCRTSISVDYSVPSEIDMGQHRSIAVASCLPVRGLKNPRGYIRALDIESELNTAVRSQYSAARFAQESAEYLTEEIERSLSKTGFFSVIGHEIADVIVEKARIGEDIAPLLKEHGIDALLLPKMTSASIDEAIGSDIYTRKDYSKKDESGRPALVDEIRYTLYQDVSLGMTYTVLDASTLSVHALRTLSGSESSSFRFYSGAIYARDPLRLARKVIDTFTGDIAFALAPHARRDVLALMKNRPESKRADEAYRLARKDELEGALEIFLSVYREEGHLPSAYNASLLLFALGRRDEALELLKSLVDADESGDAKRLLERLERIALLDEMATDQKEGRSIKEGDRETYSLLDLILVN